MVTSRPSSVLSEPTPASRMPQGMIRSNQVMSGSQLSAKPCMVTPRATRTPIAVSLRSSPRCPALDAAYCGPARRGSRPSLAPIRRVSAPMFTTRSWSTTASGSSSPSTHTPLRPSIRVVPTPKSAQARISASSRRRTYATTSSGSASLMIGYPISWPGPCQVISPPRVTSTTGVPSSGRSSGRVRRPAV